MRQPLTSVLVSIGVALLLAPGCPTEQDDDTSGDDDDIDDDDDTTTTDDDDSAADPDPYIQPETYVTPMELEPGGQATVHYGGALADGESLTLRYAFNGWNEVAGVGPFLTESYFGNTDFFIDLPMIPVEGGFEATVDLPAELRALHYEFYRGPGEDAEWDDRDGWDYHHSVPFPYIGPYLTWDAQTTAHDGVVVTFVTTVPCLGTVEYGPTAALGSTALGDELATMHHIRLTGLPADSDIHYRVRDSAGHITETTVFRTAPASPTAVRFVAMADMQVSGESNDRWDDLSQEVMAHDPAFLLIPGDLPFADTPGLWWMYFDLARELLASAVSLPVAGNHDTPDKSHHPDTSSIRAFFPLPYPDDTAAHFRIDYGNVTLLALNSESSDEMLPGGVQYGWTETQLTGILDDPDVDWVFGAFHVPPYQAGCRLHHEQMDVRPATQLFDGVVDWVFAGHEHLGQRMRPIRYDAQFALDYGNDPDLGVGYIVLPPAGHTLSDCIIAHDAPASHRRLLLAWPEFGTTDDTVESEIGFVIVETDGLALTLETWGMGTLNQPQPAHVRDVVSYVK